MDEYIGPDFILVPSRNIPLPTVKELKKLLADDKVNGLLKWDSEVIAKGTYQDYKRTGEFKAILTEVESWHMWKYMPLSTVEGHLEGKITDITAVACYIYEAIQRAKKEGTDLVATDKEPK